MKEPNQLKGRITLLTLLGPHGAGKTTLGNALNRRGIPFCTEIGFQMSKVSQIPVHLRKDNFDAMVHKAEMSRDLEIASGGKPTVVVETWHFGNAGFAAARESPKMLGPYHEAICRALQLFEVIPIFLSVSDEDFASRCQERGTTPKAALEFYRRVERQTQEMVAIYRDQLRPPVYIPANASLEIRCELVEDAIALATRDGQSLWTP